MSSAMQELTKEKFARLSAEQFGGNSTLFENAKLIALSQSLVEAMKIQTGKQALALLSCSGRILEDLEVSCLLYILLTLQLAQQSGFNVQVILREWHTFPISGEWRGFVRNKNLTALSQYFDTCYFEDVNQRKSQIIQAIVALFHKVALSFCAFHQL